MEELIARCVQCRHEFTKSLIEGVEGCPNCGNKSLPVDPREDVKILINPHEIRILTMWAMSYANNIVKDHPNGPATVKAICNDLRRKIPDCPALTLDEEIDGLKEKYGTVETNVKKDPTNMPEMPES